MLCGSSFEYRQVAFDNNTLAPLFVGGSHWLRFWADQYDMNLALHADRAIMMGREKKMSLAQGTPTMKELEEKMESTVGSVLV